MPPHRRNQARQLRSHGCLRRRVHLGCVSREVVSGGEAGLTRANRWARPQPSKARGTAPRRAKPVARLPQPSKTSWRGWPQPSKPRGAAGLSRANPVARLASAEQSPVARLALSRAKPVARLPQPPPAFFPCARTPRAAIVDYMFKKTVCHSKPVRMRAPKLFRDQNVLPVLLPSC